MKTIKYLFIITFVFQISSGFAQTDIAGGNVSGIWSYTNSPYYVNGEITIPNGETLKIEPGVKVIFTVYYAFNIQGQLLATGNKQDTITFTAQNTNVGWKGLRFIKTSSANDSSKIIFCKIQYVQAAGLGGAIYIENFDKLIISNSLITMNATYGDISSGGGGIAMVGSSPIIENNMITYNTASGGHGGGLSISSGSNPYVENNIISKNESTAGGAFMAVESNPLFINNTIVENKANISGGVPCHGGAMCIIACSPVFINNIIYGNRANIGNQIHLQGGAEPSFVNCIIEGGIRDFARDGANRGSFSGIYLSNIETDPIFINTTVNDFHPSDSSPCIGAGIDSVEFGNEWICSPNYDFEGNLRPNPKDSKPDIGAYENVLGKPVTTGLVEDLNQLTDQYQLYQNYPNPFNPTTKIKYSIPSVGTSLMKFIQLKVYDILGNEVATLVNEEKPAGIYEVEFSAGSSGDARKLTSGIYFYQLKAGNLTSTKKFLLLK